FSTVLFLLIVSGSVFFIGWIQFLIKPGTCGIMTSKTGGLYSGPVLYGEFLWRWEKLLPTNVSITLFQLQSHEYDKKVSGSLPSADVYARQVEPKPDFSYDFDFHITLSVEPQQIYDLVKSQTIENKQESLDAYLEKSAELAANAISEWFISDKASLNLVMPSVLTDKQVSDALQNLSREFTGITVVSVEINKAHVPDLAVYESAKRTFSAYEDELNSNLSEMAKQQASVLAEADNEMKRLEKFASLLEKYPQLNELSKSGNLVEIMNQLRGDR
ncbi:MAG: hypothetical protein J5857_09065, partial [Treponema sp.]|nr:hypothetical protein [Treponema sp.]